MLLKRLSFYAMGLAAIGVGLYPLMYFIVDRAFGLLGTKSDALLASIPWNIGFYAHIVLGGLALLVGWTQFHASWRKNYASAHRFIGKIYVVAAIISALASIYISFYATGGIVAKSGFFFLGIIWLYTTGMAYRAIRKKDIINHERMMIYSYAACLAAVTLRIWLPILSTMFGDFFIAYKIVAWLCWVPNLIIAHYITVRLHWSQNGKKT